MKKHTSIVVRREDGTTRNLGSDISVEEAKKEIQENFSHGKFEIIEKVKTVTENVKQEYKLEEPNINEGLLEDTIDRVKKSCEELGIDFRTPSVEEDLRSARYNYDGGSCSYSFPPEGYDFEFIIDSKKDSVFKHDFGRSSSEEIIDKVEKESGVNLIYIASSYCNYERMPRSNRGGSKLNVFAAVPREEFFGYMLKEMNYQKVDSINEIFNPGDIECSLEKPRAIRNRHKIDRDCREIAFISSNETSVVQKSSMEIAEILSYIDEEKVIDKEILEEFGFEKSPEEIAKTAEEEFDFNLNIVSGGIIVHIAYEEGTKLRSGVFVEKG